MNRKLENDEVEIDFRELFYNIKKRWWLILLCAVLGFAVTFGISKMIITPKYQSNAMLYILNKTTSVTSLADIQVGTAISEDFVVIAKSKPVLDAALQKLRSEKHDNLNRADLLDMIVVTNQDQTRILKISAVSKDAKLACDVANAIAEQTAEQMSFIMQTDPPTTIEQAEVENDPVSPDVKKNVLIGTVLGVLIALGYCIANFIANDKIRSSEDVEKYLGLSTLVIIPSDNTLKRAKGEKKGK